MLRVENDGDGRAGDVHRWVAAVVEALRAHGVPVAVGQAVACAQALLSRHVEGDDPWTRVAVGRLTLVSDPASLRVYDAVVPRLLLRPDDSDAASGPDASEPDVTDDEESGIPTAVDVSAAVAGVDEGLTAGRRTVDVERLRHRRFDRTTVAERAVIDRAVRALRVVTPQRPGRRRHPSSRGDLDLVRSLERAMRDGGELLEPLRQERRTRPRPLVLVLDISGSMAPVARTMLAFALAARRSGQGRDRRSVEVFAFGTRLTRLTPALDRRDVDTALAHAAERIVDWDGGTRIGASLGALVRTWGPRGVLRGAVVVVCSDGLERGDPDMLGTAARALRRRCHRLVWVSPLAGSPDFEPVQRGLAAALDAIDVLLPGHDLGSIERLATVIADSSVPGGPEERRRRRLNRLSQRSAQAP